MKPLMPTTTKNKKVVELIFREVRWRNVTVIYASANVQCVSTFRNALQLTVAEKELNDFRRFKSAKIRSRAKVLIPQFKFRLQARAYK